MSAAMTTSLAGHAAGPDMPFDALVRAAADGDRGALTDVLTEIREPIIRYCRSRIGRREQPLVSADDVAQEALLAVMTSLPTYQRRNGVPFLAFAYGITSNKVVDALRRARRNRSVPTADVPDLPHTTRGPEDLAVAADGYRRLRDLVDTLTPTERDVLTLRVVVGMSAAEVAGTIGSNPASVRVSQHRALRKLRALLDPHPSRAIPTAEHQEK